MYVEDDGKMSCVEYRTRYPIFFVLSSKLAIQAIIMQNSESNQQAQQQARYGRCLR
jgi:hypothetical protein